MFFYPTSPLFIHHKKNKKTFVHYPVCQNKKVRLYIFSRNVFNIERNQKYFLQMYFLNWMFLQLCHSVPSCWWLVLQHWISEQSREYYIGRLFTIGASLSVLSFLYDAIKNWFFSRSSPSKVERDCLFGAVTIW